jgi:D-glycero-alpha-D-manno-heptose-7-phosphate kinase
LIAALACRLGRQLATEEIAELASHIEIERMRMPIGYQDQYAAAFGGLNCLEISRDRRCLRPCAATPDVRRALEQRLLLFFTGKRRRSTDILQAQRDASRRAGSSTVEALHEIKHIAEQMIAALECGDLDHVGRLLHDSWVQKRRLAPGVTTPEIDAWYAEARDAGALGGKITGAGGGGFLMLYADPARRSAVIQRMSELGLVWVDADFDVAGVTTLLREPAGLAVA